MLQSHIRKFQLLLCLVIVIQSIKRLCRFDENDHNDEDEGKKPDFIVNHTIFNEAIKSTMRDSRCGIFIYGGASGAGKTWNLRYFQKSNTTNFDLLYLDSRRMSNQITSQLLRQLEKISSDKLSLKNKQVIQDFFSQYAYTHAYAHAHAHLERPLLLVLDHFETLRYENSRQWVGWLAPALCNSQLRQSLKILFVSNDYDFTRELLWIQLTAKIYPLGDIWHWNAFRWTLPMTQQLINYHQDNFYHMDPLFYERSYDSHNPGCIVKEFNQNILRYKHQQSYEMYCNNSWFDIK